MAHNHNLVLLNRRNRTTTSLIIGHDQTAFNINKSLLCSSSRYFESAYNSGLRESRDDRFVLEDFDKDVFKIVFTWLHSGQIYLGSKPLRLNESVEETDHTYVPPEGSDEDPPVEKEIRGAWSSEFVQRESESETLAEDEAMSDEDEDESNGDKNESSEEDDESNEDEDESNEDEDESESTDGAEECGSDFESEDVWDEDAVAIAIPDRYRGLPHHHYELGDKDHMKSGSEQDFFHRVFYVGTTPETEAADLDIYQLEVMLKLAEHGVWTAFEQDVLRDYLPGWIATLEAKETALAEQTEAESEVLDVLEVLVEMYILADRFDIPTLRTEIMDHLESQRLGENGEPGTFLPPFSVVNRAFEGLPSNSKLLLWLKNIYAYGWDPKMDEPEEAAEREKLPKEFLFDVFVLGAGKLPDQHDLDAAPWFGEHDMCAYHEHASFEESEGCRRKRNQEPDCEDPVEEDVEMMDA